MNNRYITTLSVHQCNILKDDSDCFVVNAIYRGKISEIRRHIHLGSDELIGFLWSNDEGRRDQLNQISVIAQEVIR